MRRSGRQFALLVALTALAPASAAVAQQPTAPVRPDFSGERTLNRQASALAPEMAAIQSGTLRIEHSEPTIRLRLMLVADGKPFETVVEQLTDGREVSSVQQGRATVARAWWEGDALMLTGRAQGPTCERSVTFRYELQDGGRRVRATEAIRGCGRDQDNVWVFDRP